jgi:hypothetical protein
MSSVQLEALRKWSAPMAWPVLERIRFYIARLLSNKESMFFSFGEL